MHHCSIVTVVAGVGLLAATAGSVFSQPPSARDVLERFCDLDAQGKQLTPAGWRTVAALFATPGAPRRDEIIVVKDFVVSHPALEKGKAEFYVEYVQLGRIDPTQARFSRLPQMKVRAGFYVIKQPGPGVADGSDRAEKPGEWRIEGSPPEPHLTVDAAIRYATRLLASAGDDAIKRNARQTLSALKRLR